MKTVLVTGAAGFIGSNLVPALEERGYRVVVVDLKSNPAHDIRDKEDLKKVFEEEKPNLVVHLAAEANIRNAVTNPYPYISTNIEGTLNVLELCKDFKVENLVIASSSSVYGNDPNVPWKEDHPASEPVSPYGVSKRTAELLAYTYQRNFGLNVTCLRYFNAYGENNRRDLVPYIWGMAILNNEEIEISGDGSRERDYTYVGDVVKGTIMALEKPLGFEIFNIGNSKPVSLKDLVEVFRKVSGTEVRVRSRPSNSVSMERTYADISKAKKLLGWEPTVSIEEGITKLLAWLRDNRLEKSV